MTESYPVLEKYYLQDLVAFLIVRFAAGFLAATLALALVLVLSTMIFSCYEQFNERVPHLCSITVLCNSHAASEDL
jgi:hypothetical protein